MLKPDLIKNDKKAHLLIWIFSIVIFLAITLLEGVQLKVDLGFNPHIFAGLSAAVNFGVACCLIIALVLVKKGNIILHRKVMLVALGLSVFFLLFYVAHHLFAGATKYGDINQNGILEENEKLTAGSLRLFYYFIISTHIVLAGIVMPFVLYTAYRAMIGEYAVHKKIAKWTFPIWLYVAITGVLVYLLISPFYN
ncbi:MAG: DUF420 domain-containing protein [Chitinophagaceae bacterium]|nr:DUF420 domain-containing protein [Chitinophagaceae bacterium]